MPLYDYAFDRAPNYPNKGWVAPGANLTQLRYITRGGVQMFVLGSELQNADRVFGVDTDIAGTNKVNWRTYEVADPGFTLVFNYPAGGNTAGTQNVAHYTGNAGFATSFPNAVCINIAHDSLLETTGTFRLKRATGTTAETTGVTGTITKQTAPYGGGNYVCFRVGTQAEMTTAFGAAESLTGANWILEKQNPPPITYTEVSRWNITSGSGNAGNTGAADYWQGSGDTGSYRPGFFVNNIPHSGNAGWIAIPNPPTGTYRIRTVGGTLGARELAGSLTIEQPDTVNRRVIRTGTGAEMRAAFGNQNVGSGGGQVILERQN